MFEQTHAENRVSFMFCYEIVNKKNLLLYIIVYVEVQGSVAINDKIYLTFISL